MTERVRDRAAVARYNREYYKRRKARDPGYLAYKSRVSSEYRKLGSQPERKLRVINRTTVHREWRRPKCESLGVAPILWGFPSEWIK